MVDNLKRPKSTIKGGFSGSDDSQAKWRDQPTLGQSRDRPLLGPIERWRREQESDHTILALIAFWAMSALADNATITVNNHFDPLLLKKG